MTYFTAFFVAVAIAAWILSIYTAAMALYHIGAALWDWAEGVLAVHLNTRSARSTGQELETVPVPAYTDNDSVIPRYTSGPWVYTEGTKYTVYVSEYDGNTGEWRQVPLERTAPGKWVDMGLATRLIADEGTGSE